MTSTLGCDVAFYQDNDDTFQQINFIKMRDAGARFVIVRAGQNISRDPDWRYNWGEAAAAGLLRGAYWVHDYRKPILPQAQAFVDLLRSYPVEVPEWWDLEYVEKWGERPKRINLLPALHDALICLKESALKKPVLYTNLDMILNILSPVPEWLLEFDLAIALPNADKPLTGPWKDWRFWQYTWKGNGPMFGVESKSIDLDWFNGSYEDLLRYCGLAVEEPETVSLAEWATRADAWMRANGYKGPRPGGVV